MHIYGLKHRMMFCVGPQAPEIVNCVSPINIKAWFSINLGTIFLTPDGVGC